MRVVFCIYDFVEAKLPLQPWLTIRLIAECLARRGHEVHLVSDVPAPARLTGCQSHSVASLRGSNAAQMKGLLGRLRPDVLVFLPTPLNIATASWLDGIECRRVGFASYPFYSAGELMTAARHIGRAEVKQYLRHLLVPGFSWKRAMRRRMHALVAQSETTAARLNAWLGQRPFAACIPPGIDLTQWPLAQTREPARRERLQLLYLGAAIPIRGFQLALAALAGSREAPVDLRVLARGAGPDQIAAIEANVVRHGLQGRVEVEGGWIDHARLVEEIRAADAVLQPFVLVPSELPVTAMEVIACGTPVIGARIDGLPSTIGPAGAVVKQADAAALGEQIAAISREPAILEKWKNGCVEQRARMRDWDRITDEWEAVLGG